MRNGRTLALLVALGAAPGLAACEDLMSDFDEPHAATEENVSFVGTVTEQIEDDVFMVQAEDPKTFVRNTIIVFLDSPNPELSKDARARFEGRATTTTSSALRERLGKPGVDTSLGRFDPQQVLFADSVEVMTET